MTENFFDKRLDLRCPTCKRLVARAPLMASATTVLRRRCRGCRTGWQVVVKPLSVRPGMAVHEATWTVPEGGSAPR